MELDQFYTRPNIANNCFQILLKTLPRVQSRYFIEPSAGNGSFYNLLPENRRIGIDLVPAAKEIIKADFLSWRPNIYNRNNSVVVGNPPFGNRSNLAINFFNHSAEMASVIAFIVPNQFQKYSVHSKLNKRFSLIKNIQLPEEAFYTPDNKSFSLRSVFQIWTDDEVNFINKRILIPPPINHPDFEMYQYNNTPEALKVFKKNWDFAVPRQGYEDYSRREKDEKKCEKNKQWILFKPKNSNIYKRLWNMDFFSLAKRNTVVYGFGKADVVSEYTNKYAR
jgi:hypothetical protein